MRHLEKPMKSYRTSTEQGGSHSKNAFLDALWNILKKAELILFSIFLKIELWENGENLRLERILGNHLVLLCLTNGKKQSPKKMNVWAKTGNWLQSSGPMRSLWPSYTFLWITSSPNHYPIPLSTSRSFCCLTLMNRIPMYQIMRTCSYILNTSYLILISREHVRIHYYSIYKNTFQIPFLSFTNLLPRVSFPMLQFNTKTKGHISKYINFSRNNHYYL